jgi:hypothetical protein
MLEIYRCAQEEAEMHDDLSTDWVVPFFLALDLLVIFVAIFWCRQRPKEKLKVN